MNTERLQALRDDSVALATMVAESTRQIGVLAGFPGLGKTYAALCAIVLAVALGLKVVLIGADYRILGEIQRKLEGQVRCRVLRGRGRSCRVAEQWHEYDRLHLYATGYQALCANCPQLEVCEARTELKELLANVDVVLVTSAKAGIQDGFMQKVMVAMEDLRLLTVYDEDLYIRTVRHEKVPLNTLHEFATAIPDIAAGMTAFLATPGAVEARALWAALQDIEPLEMETAWHQQFPTKPCPLPNLWEALSVPAEDRWIEGYLLHSVRRPQILGPAIIGAQMLRPSIIRHYCEIPDGVLLDPTPPITEMHDETRICNWMTSMGSDRFFGSNAGTIIRGFAPLLRKAQEEGRRLLFVARKEQLNLCRRHLEEVGRELGYDWRVVTSADPGFDPEQAGEPEPGKLVVIHYGVAGVNAFEFFDGVVCLSSYYIPTWALNEAFNAPLRPWERIKGQIHTDEQGYRTARLPGDAPPALQNTYADLFLAMEIDVVLNTVGRVRPWTRPRLVVLQQRNRVDIQGLVVVRRQADLLMRLGATGPTLRDTIAARRRAEIQSLLATGCTQAQIADRIGLSTRQIRRILHGFWPSAGADITPNII